MTRRLRELVLWAGAALGLLAVAAGLAVAFFGFNLLVFRSGSMSPEIPTGGLALSQTVAAADVAEGDVVSVTTSTGDRVTHRVVTSTLRGDEASLVLQGDANATPDEEIYQVTSADRVVASVPWGGYVLAHALTPPGLVATGALGLMLVMIGFSEPADRRAAAAPAPTARGGQPSHRRPRRRGRSRVFVAGSVAIALVCAGAVLGGGVGGTWARFTDQVTLKSGSFNSTSYFTCAGATTGIGNPAIWYRMDELTGLILGDSSGNSRAATATGLPTRVGTGACKRDNNSALSFANQNYATGNQSFALPATLTVSVWFRTTTRAGGRILGWSGTRTGSSGANNDRHLYMLNDGRIAYGAFPASGRVAITSSAAGGSAYNDGQWHQAVGVISPAGIKLYVDGALQSQNSDVTTGRAYTNGAALRMGFDDLTGWPNEPTSDYFTGDLDEVIVYTTEPSAASVADAYRAALPN